MSSYIFESIELSKKHPANVFVVSIEKSSFHCHYEYEFILVLKGSVILTTSPRTTELSAGDLALVNTNAVHELKRANNQNLCLCVQVSPDLFTDYRDKNKTFIFYLNSQSKDLAPRNSFQSFTSLLAQIGLSFEKDDLVSYHRTRALLYKLVADLFTYTHYDVHQKPQNSQSKNNSEMLMKIIEYIQKKLAKENLAQDLCHDLGISEKTLYRFLKSSIGLSFKNIVDANRVEVAKITLKASRKPVSHIAYDCGFGSENTFYRVFKNETGVTPQEYRKNGSQLEANPDVKGYLNYNQAESQKLLKKLV